jgi:enoyl-CoA hydratase/carnithine racemase
MRDEEGFREFLNDGRALMRTIELASQPAIALVNGFAVAGGIELLLACDFAYAAESAKIGDGHVNFGQVGGGGSHVRLPRRISIPRAREILFTGKLLSAQEALEWGLVNRVVPDDKLIDAGLEFANIIAQKSPLGIRIVKRLVNEGLNLDEEAIANLEIQMVHHYALTSYDCHEGLRAFSEKQKPKFEGR